VVCVAFTPPPPPPPPIAPAATSLVVVRVGRHATLNDAHNPQEFLISTEQFVSVGGFPTFIVRGSYSFYPR